MVAARQCRSGPTTGGRRILTELAAVGCYPAAPPAKPRPQHEDMPSANAIPAWLGVGQAGPGLSAAASPLGSVGTRARKLETKKMRQGKQGKSRWLDGWHPEILTRYPTVTVATCHNEESAGGSNKAGALDDQEVPPPSALHTVVVFSFEVCEKAAHLVLSFAPRIFGERPTDRTRPL